MAYNNRGYNNYNQQRFTYFDRYQGTNWDTGRNRYRRPDYVPKRPKSGCKMQQDYHTRTGKHKELVISGWKVTKRFGYMTFAATPASDKYQTDNPNYTKMVVILTSPTGKSVHWANWNIQKKLLWIPDLRLVADPYKNYVSYIAPKNSRR